MKRVVSHYNVRPLNEGFVQELLRDFALNGITPWLFPMYVLVDPSWVDASKVTNSMNTPWAEYPADVWTEAAKGQDLVFLSGNHRVAAVHKAVEGHLAAKEDAARRLEETDKLRDVEVVSGQMKSELQQIVKNAEVSYERTRHWAIVLLDRSTSSPVIYRVLFKIRIDRIYVCRQAHGHECSSPPRVKQGARALRVYARRRPGPVSDARGGAAQTVHPRHLVSYCSVRDRIEGLVRQCSHQGIQRDRVEERRSLNAATQVVMGLGERGPAVHVLPRRQGIQGQRHGRDAARCATRVHGARTPGIGTYMCCLREGQKNRHSQYAQAWCEMIRLGIQQLAILASPKRLPALDDEDDTDSMAFINVLRLAMGCQDEELLIAPEDVSAVLDDKVSKKLENLSPKQRQKVYQFAKGRSRETFASILRRDHLADTVATSGALFNIEMMDRIDDEYVRHCRPQLATWTNGSTDYWEQGLKTYFVAVDKLVVQGAKTLATATGSADATVRMQRSLQGKLDWLGHARNVGLYPQVPLPTRSWIADHLQVLDSVGVTMTWVSPHLLVSLQSPPVVESRTGRWIHAPARTCTHRPLIGLKGAFLTMIQSGHPRGTLPETVHVQPVNVNISGAGR